MAESFVKTLKQEEVDGRAYRTLTDAKGSIGNFIEQVYNRQRLHSALAYLAPASSRRSSRHPGLLRSSPGSPQPTVPNSVSQRQGALQWCPRIRVGSFRRVNGVRCPQNSNFGLSLSEAARALGLSRRQVAYYD